eukprot:gene17989-21424_t
MAEILLAGVGAIAPPLCKFILGKCLDDTSRGIAEECLAQLSVIFGAATCVKSNQENCKELLKHLVQLRTVLQRLGTPLPTSGGTSDNSDRRVSDVLQALLENINDAKQLIYKCANPSSIWQIMHATSVDNEFQTICGKISRTVELFLVEGSAITHELAEDVRALSTNMTAAQYLHDEKLDGLKVALQDMTARARKTGLATGEMLQRIIDKLDENQLLSHDPDQRKADIIELHTQLCEAKNNKMEREEYLIKQLILALQVSDTPATIFSFFFCPITREVMTDPVISIVSSCTYERAAIETWLNEKGNTTDPLTRKEMTAADLRPNLVVKSMIDEWLKTSSHLQFDDQTTPAGPSGTIDGANDHCEAPYIPQAHADDRHSSAGQSGRYLETGDGIEESDDELLTSRSELPHIDDQTTSAGCSGTIDGANDHCEVPSIPQPHADDRHSSAGQSGRCLETGDGIEGSDDGLSISPELPHVDDQTTSAGPSSKEGNGAEGSDDKIKLRRYPSIEHPGKYTTQYRSDFYVPTYLDIDTISRNMDFVALVWVIDGGREVQERCKAARKLYLHSKTNTQRRNAIAEAGGIVSLIGMLGVDIPEVEEGKTAALKALRQLSYEDNLRSIIVYFDGFSPLLPFLSADRKKDDKTAAAGIIRNLFCIEILRRSLLGSDKAGGCNIHLLLIGMLRDHPGCNKEGTAHATRALMSMCADDETSSNLIVAAGGVPALVSLLIDYNCTVDHEHARASREKVRGYHIPTLSNSFGYAEDEASTKADAAGALVTLTTNALMSMSKLTQPDAAKECAPSRWILYHTLFSDVEHAIPLLNKLLEYGTTQGVINAA